MLNGIDLTELGLVAYYNFDEGQGNRAFDATNNNHHLFLGKNDTDMSPLWIASTAPIPSGRTVVRACYADTYCVFLLIL
jgi:hypothetical protein